MSFKSININFMSRGLFRVSGYFFCLLVLIAVTLSPVRADEADRAFRLFNSEKFDEAFPLLLELAKDGNPRAQGTLSRMYINGWGTSKSNREAYYWASRGIEKDDPASQHVMGYINWLGLAGFKKDVDEAIRWFQRSAGTGYENSFGYLALVYEEASHLAGHEQKAFDWHMKSALSGNAVAMTALGEIYAYGLLNQEKDKKKALEWLEKGAALGSVKAHYLAGLIYVVKEEVLRNPAKAIFHLETARTMGSDWAAYYLAHAYLFGNTLIKQDKDRGYSILKELHKKESSYIAYELESAIYETGLDRPVNTQKAVLNSLNAIRLKLSKGEEDTKRFGTTVGYLFLFGTDLPASLWLAWYRLHIGVEDAEGDYKKERSRLDPAIVKRSEALELPELVEKTIEYLEQRRTNIGPIEASDLVNEGWAQFIGRRGKVNEPLAQLLTEEGLRIAIRTENKLVEDAARNNLGVIFIASANQKIRNARLAHVHLYDGRGSEWGPSNLLWLNYIGDISLSDTELDELRARHKKEQGVPHRAENLPQIPAAYLTSPKKVVDFLISIYKDGDTDLAMEIGDRFEITAVSKADYERAIYWYKLGKTEESRIRRLEKIMSGDYVADVPNFTGTVNQLFEVDLVETRGGLLTNLTSAFSSPRKGVSALDKSKGKLNLHALVIGNSTYKNKELENSANDAKAIARKLREFGFTVKEAFDLDRRSFRDTLITFSQQAKDSDVTIFFYAGHGMQVGGVNYLLPTDIDFKKPEAIVTYDGISLNDLKSRSLPGATRLIFLDACRNNPFDLVTRGGQGRGLAPINVGTGTLISFATRDGSVAFDGVGGVNSPYTQALLKHIDSKEDVELMLRAVGDEVMRLTKNTQQPWKYGALSGQKVVIPTLSK
uniref:caspase family protein n=1 Tax=Orrella sp. TaxID=1921583 RepID=UPI004048870B